MSPTTITNFFAGRPVQRKQFHAICKKLKLDWHPEQTQPSQLKTENCNLDELVRAVRGQQGPKLMAEYGKIQLPLTRQRVAVSDLYVDVYVLTRLTSDYRATVQDLWRSYDRQRDRTGLGEREGNRKDGETLVKQDNYRRTVVLGKPGSGKSTFMQRLGVGCINGELFADRIPALVLLRKINAETLQIPAYLQQEWGISDSELDKILDNGKALLLLDGLDEVPGQFQARIKQGIERFARTYPQVGIIVTCRTQTVEYGLNAFEFLEVADFNREQVTQFAQNWFTADDATTAAAQTKEFIAALDAHPAIAELAITPILLGLSCLLWRDRGNLPARRGELYEQGIELLLREWDEYREINRECESETYRKLSIEQRQDLLGFIALQKFQHPQNFVLFGQRELQDLVGQQLKIGQSESEKILRIIEEHHGLLIRRAHQVYSFSHLTFQEYFVARELTRLDNDELLNQITNTKWQEVFQLAISRMKDPSDLLWRTKQQIDQQLANDAKLQQFLQWVHEKARSVQAPYKPAAIRAFYFDLVHDRALVIHRSSRRAFRRAFDFALVFPSHFPIHWKHTHDRVRALTVILDRDRDWDQALDKTCDPAFERSFDRALDLDLTLALERALDFDWMIYVIDNFCIDSVCDQELALALACIFACLLAFRRAFDFAFVCASVKKEVLELPIKLEGVCNQLPKWDTNFDGWKTWWQHEGAGWVEQLRQVMIEHRNIGHDWQFSDAQIEQLQHYYNANTVLVELLKSDNVSAELRQEIEETLLLPLSELEQRQTAQPSA